jgi:hypothetical protein
MPNGEVGSKIIQFPHGNEISADEIEILDAQRELMALAAAACTKLDAGRLRAINTTIHSYLMVATHFQKELEALESQLHLNAK